MGKKNATSFKAGQTGNPNGRPKKDPELEALKDLTKQGYRRIALKYLNMTTEEVLKLKEDKSLTMLEWAFVKCIMKVHQKGDYITLDRIMDRVIGKVKEEVEVTDTPHALVMQLLAKKKQLADAEK